MNEPVFHPLDGRQDCLACHGGGASGAPTLPSSHDDMTSATCLTCHPPALPAAGVVYWGALPFVLVFVVGVARLTARPARRAARRRAATPPRARA